MLPRGKVGKPCLTYTSCIVLAQFFLYHLFFYTGTFTDAPRRVTYNNCFNYDSQYPKYFMCHITKPVWFSVASKLSNPARIRSAIQECINWLQQSIQDHIFYHKHAIQNFAKNCNIVFVTVHVTDLISTIYHYASKGWLIF